MFRNLLRPGSRTQVLTWLAWVGCVLGRGQTIAVTDASSSFAVVIKSDGTLMTDPFNDQQTGQLQADFISFAANTTTVYQNGAATPTATGDVPGFFVKAGALGADPGQKYLMYRFRFHDANNSKAYEGSYVMIGVDLTQDGRPDIIFGVDSTNATPRLDFLKPGAGANTSPNTTTSGSYTTVASTKLTSATFAYTAAPVSYDIVPNSTATNMQLTFAISYGNLQRAIRDMGTVNGTNFSNFYVTATTPMNFMAYTSQQDNAFNQDLYGGDFQANSTATWTALGGFSTTFDGSGRPRPTPEGSTIVQSVVLLGAGGLVWVRRKRGKRQANGEETVVAPARCDNETATRARS